MSRGEMQERNRVRVLAAARAEFADRGYRDAKIDVIAERAELTRGAVYSNFPGKRALYFAVLAADVARLPPESHTVTGSVGDSLGRFARAWLAGLPLATEQDPAARLGVHLIPEVLADERTRLPFAQLLELDAILLGLTLERQAASPHRMVRTAGAVLTLLHGAGQLAAAAPGFGEPFDVVRVCEQLADLHLDDQWAPPHLPYVPPPRPTDGPWSPPPAVDALRGEPVPFGADAVVAVLGLHRLSAVEEAVRAAPPGTDVVAALVTGDPGELAPLARLTVADLVRCLAPAFPRTAWPALHLVHDDGAALARAVGVSAVSDATETAIRVRGGRIVARADGLGACHAIASAP